MAINFAIAPINWSNDDDQTLGANISLDQCLSEMVEAGFQGCEIGHKFPKQLTDLQTCMERYGLQITSDWIGTRLTEEDNYHHSIESFKRRVHFLKVLGVKALKVCECGHSVQNSDEPIFHSAVSFSQQQWHRLIQGLHEMGGYAREHGLFVAYHQHLGTGVEKKADLEHLMRNTDPELVTLLPDTGHLYAAGMDPLEIFSTFRSRIKYIHLKDVRAEIFHQAKTKGWSFMAAVRAGLFTVPSDGCLEFAPLFAHLKESKYDGWLVVEAEQDPAKASPLQYARKARELLKEHFYL